MDENNPFGNAASVPVPETPRTKSELEDKMEKEFELMSKLEAENKSDREDWEQREKQKRLTVLENAIAKL